MRFFRAAVGITLLASLGCGTDLEVTDDEQREIDDAHGGDPMSMLFTEARFNAVVALRQVSEADLRSTDHRVSRAAATWLVDNRWSLSDDVDGTSHTWTKEVEAECAKTTAIPKAEITFSSPVCHASVKDVDDAIRLLIHESVHHLGVEDDQLADTVALLVLPFASPRDPSVPGVNDGARSGHGTSGDDGITDVQPANGSDDGAAQGGGQQPRQDADDADEDDVGDSGGSRGGWYGALAYDRVTRRYGMSWRASTGGNAENSAMDACRETGCELQVTFRDACAALAMPETGGTAFWARSASREEARTAALSTCHEFNGQTCSSVTVCSDGF